MEIPEFGPLSPEWPFYGLDPSADMLSLARKKISEKGIQNEIRLTRGYVDDHNDTDVFDGATFFTISSEKKLFSKRGLNG